MPHTIARLRRGILVLGGLLIVVLIGFLAYAHYRIRRFEKDLPGRLGVNIQQTANGYTYSQSSKGHTLFTIHASKLIEYKHGGNARLHDVAITLYGPPGSSRVDKIQGADFSYDAPNQIVTAQGPVSIDLQGFGSGGQAASPRNTIHVKTSGLVFNQKTGEADTSQYTEFSFPRASGSSTGAHYNSETGVLVLDSDVALTTASGRHPAVIHASHARIERDSNQAFLTDPSTIYGSEKASSDTGIIGFRDDGSAQSINAQGHVRVITAAGAVLTAANSMTELNDKSQPMRTDVGGGVNFVSNTPDERMSGAARSGTLTFGDNSILTHAQFRDKVSYSDEVLHLANDAKGTASRWIDASTLDVDFVPGPGGKRAIARKAIAVGNALVHLRATPSKGPQQATDISGNRLVALLAPDGKSMRQLNGSGGTKISTLSKDGSTSDSTGDNLEVTFAAKAGPSKGQTAQIETAIQDGNVVLTQTPQKKSGSPAPATLTAWAQRAEYHASDQILHLTGNPRLDDGQLMQITANQIDYHRDTGDAAAAGDVKATYTESKGQHAPGEPALGGSGPVHITADHALLRHAANASIFYGAGATDARLWQGANSILAPMLELTHAPGTLKAHGAPGSTGAVVSANLTSATGPNHRQSPVRVQSHTLVYSDAARRGDFRGEVSAAGPDGVIHADDAQVYLTPAAKSGQKSAQARGEHRQAQLERVVATGHVVLRQPGRTGTGEKLVYTADNGQYVLTGAPRTLPRIEDAAKGVTTGAKLIFNSQDDSVVVSGGQSAAVTETRAPR